MIAKPNNIDIAIFNDGISPRNIQVNIPKDTVPIPNPSMRIFHKWPKCSTANLVA